VLCWLLVAAIAARGAEPIPSTGAQAGTSNAAAAAAGGAGVKRERDAGDAGDDEGDEDDQDYGVPRSATAAVDIDLTQEVSRSVCTCETLGLCGSKISSLDSRVKH
jgi:hypothetical protein